MSLFTYTLTNKIPVNQTKMNETDEVWIDFKLGLYDFGGSFPTVRKAHEFIEKIDAHARFIEDTLAEYEWEV